MENLTLEIDVPCVSAGLNMFTALAVGERPQERMERLGSGALSDVELLAVVLGGGSPKRDTITLAAALLGEVGTLAGLCNRSVAELAAMPGVGAAAAAAAARLTAVREIAARMVVRSDEQAVLNRADLVAGFMAPDLLGLEVEKFWVLVLNRKNRLLRKVVCSSGTATAALAHPREVFREAIRWAGTAIVCCHNHPSGDPAPSAADLQITRQLREAAKAVDIDLLDHVILGRAGADPTGRGYYSFREAGLI